MEQTLVSKLKKEGLYIFILFIVGVMLFKILFFKEEMVTIIRAVFSLFWLFILPGFIMMYYWSENLDFTERLVIGSVLGMVTLGVIGYNLGLIGLTMKYQIWIVPILSIIVGIPIIIRKSKKEEKIKEYQKV